MLMPLTQSAGDALHPVKDSQPLLCVHEESIENISEVGGSVGEHDLEVKPRTMNDTFEYVEHLQIATHQ